MDKQFTEAKLKTPFLFFQNFFKSQISIANLIIFYQKLTQNRFNIEVEYNFGDITGVFCCSSHAFNY